jgi:hypothetical protein
LPQDHAEVTVLEGGLVVIDCVPGSADARVIERVSDRVSRSG